MSVRSLVEIFAAFSVGDGNVCDDLKVSKQLWRLGSYPFLINKTILKAGKGATCAIKV